MIVMTVAILVYGLLALLILSEQTAVGGGTSEHSSGSGANQQG